VAGGVGVGVGLATGVGVGLATGVGVGDAAGVGLGCGVGVGVGAGVGDWQLQWLGLLSQTCGGGTATAGAANQMAMMARLITKVAVRLISLLLHLGTGRGRN
jgi:hypothetical protein